MTTGGINWTAIHRRLAVGQQQLAGLSEFSDERLQALLRERACKLAERRSSSPAHQTFQAMVVRAGPERYALELTKLAGVLPFGQCAPLAGGPGELLGLINAHGEIWAAFEFQRLLGAKADVPPTSGYVVLLRHGRRRVGLRVDEVDRVRTLTLRDLRQSDDKTSRNPIEVVKAVTSDAVILVDLANLWAHSAIGEGR